MIVFPAQCVSRQYTVQFSGDPEMPGLQVMLDVAVVVIMSDDEGSVYQY